MSANAVRLLAEHRDELFHLPVQHPPGAAPKLCLNRLGPIGQVAEHGFQGFFSGGGHSPELPAPVGRWAPAAEQSPASQLLDQSAHMGRRDGHDVGQLVLSDAERLCMLAGPKQEELTLPQPPTPRPMRNRFTQHLPAHENLPEQFDPTVGCNF